MDVLEAMRTRRSVRRYLKTRVDNDKVGVLLDAARSAPSAGNLQNWKYILVTDEAKRMELANAAFQQFWMQDAPLHMVVCAEPEKGARFYGIRGERLYSVQNCAAAVQNILVAANKLGLGSCWVGAFDEDAVRRALRMPDNIRPQAIITVGYPAECPQAPPKLKITDITFMELWGNKNVDLGMTLREWSQAKNALNLEKNLRAGKKYVDTRAPDVIRKIREKTDSLKKSTATLVRKVSGTVKTERTQDEHP